ncbi:MAG: hypothetical protein AAFR87_25480 [Bacteroidota bacterium]
MKGAVTSLKKSYLRQRSVVAAMEKVGGKTPAIAIDVNGATVQEDYLKTTHYKNQSNV